MSDPTYCVGWCPTCRAKLTRVGWNGPVVGHRPDCTDARRRQKQMRAKA